jgi:hypothetical protein
MEQKQCGRCKEIKDFTEFSKNEGSLHGLHTTCKVCKRELHKIWRKANPKKVSDYQKKHANKINSNRERINNYAAYLSKRFW